MIKRLSIRNFKSVRNLELACDRINIFIGEPNTGKSNILEAIGLLSFLFYGSFAPTPPLLEKFVRFESMINLFYDENLEEKIEIESDLGVLNIEFDGDFRIKWKDKLRVTADYRGVRERFPGIEELRAFKFYRFEVLDSFLKREPSFLLPPAGENLLTVLMTHKDLRKFVSEVFRKFGLRVVLKPQEDKIEVQKEIEDVVIAHPYALCSETLQRIIFYLTAIKTNKDSIIAFEEPESHAFPYYTKYLAERIALDKNNNQFFISTHNPYFLLPLVEKAQDVAVFITFMEDYQTKVKKLSSEEIESVLDIGMDVFFNIERFLEQNE